MIRAMGGLTCGKAGRSRRDRQQRPRPFGVIDRRLLRLLTSGGEAVAPHVLEPAR